jgi:hypothetical protein
VDGWTFLEAGASDAPTTVLMLPGALCAGAFYTDALADPQLDGAGVRLVAATPPSPAPAPRRGWCVATRTRSG